MATHKCAICDVADEKTVYFSACYVHSSLYMCIAALQKHNTELRSLLDTAVDAWEYGKNVWKNGVCTDVRLCGLPWDWYEKAKEVVDVQRSE